MLQNGRIDVYGYPTLSISSLLKKAKDPNIELISPVEGTPIGCAGAAFRKTDRAFRDAYDEGLYKIKESGEFDEILAQYGFPVKAAKMITRQELCGGEN
jgi:polar amino acid transport system substrate-binding protein